MKSRIWQFLAPHARTLAVTIDRFQTSPPCRVGILISPKAGSGAGRTEVPRLQQLLEESGIACQQLRTPDELTEYVAGDGASDTVIVAAGGDGTIALAATMVGQRPGVSIVPMPLGTENLLARYFGHTVNAAQVLSTIRSGIVRTIDSGVANGRPFLIMATCGFDAEVVRGVHVRRKGHISKWSYAGPIVRAIRRYRFPDISVRIDGGDPILCRWAMVFNLPSYGGGLRIEPGAIGDDGHLDVMMFQSGKVLGGLRYVAGVCTGRHIHFRDVSRIRGSVIEISSQFRVPFQLDGDYAGRLPLRIETRPASVRLLVPEEVPK